mmetsp:Transcript_26174/g.79513  ORF Transcript_26174/g.79513 Transcript_26174/m.79513 type:complete len:207 (+) Transcript_26174:228-848(+)
MMPSMHGCPIIANSQSSCLRSRANNCECSLSLPAPTLILLHLASHLAGSQTLAPGPAAPAPAPVRFAAFAAAARSLAVLPRAATLLPPPTPPPPLSTNPAFGGGGSGGGACREPTRALQPDATTLTEWVSVRDGAARGRTPAAMEGGTSISSMPSERSEQEAHSEEKSTHAFGWILWAPAVPRAPNEDRLVAAVPPSRSASASTVS